MLLNTKAAHMATPLQTCCFNPERWYFKKLNHFPMRVLIAGELFVPSFHMPIKAILIKGRSQRLVTRISVELWKDCGGLLERREASEYFLG